MIYLFFRPTRSGRRDIGDIARPINKRRRKQPMVGLIWIIYVFHSTTSAHWDIGDSARPINERGRKQPMRGLVSLFIFSSCWICPF